MKLEDLFKTKEPTNYVGQASQVEANPLEQFFKDRTPKPKAPVTPTAKTIQPITEQKIETIKTEYAPAAQGDSMSEYSQQSSFMRNPATDSYIPVSDVVDIEKIKQQAKQLAPDMGWKDVLTSLTPLAVEAILGGGQMYSGSPGVAAESLMSGLKETQKRRQTLEDKLMELKKLSSPKADTEASRQARFEAAQKQRQSNEDRRIILQTRDKLNQDLQFKAARARYGATNDAVNVLNQRNPIGDASVKTLFAKGIFAEVGAMSDKDKADFIGSPALERVFDRMISKYKNGILDEKDRGDLIKLAVHLRERAKKDASRIASSYTKGIQSFGLDPSAVIQPLLATEDISPQGLEEENLVERNTPDGPALFDRKTKKFVRWK